MTNASDIIVKTILAHLKQSGQMDQIGAIVDALKATSEYKNSKSKAVVTSATKLEASELKTIKSYLSNSIGDEYELYQLVDPALVGGFTLQINDSFIDASILGKINMVQNKLTAKE